MLCEHCHQKPATVHVTEVPESEDDQGVQERHLCDVCAQTLDLPHMPAVKQTMAHIWKLLQLSAQQSKRRRGVACPECGLTLDEFRRKGRLGCPRCYQVFHAQVLELLERVHGARQHVGRLPGVSEQELDRLQRSAELQRQLEVAIREEAYETAARLRDEIQALAREAETEGSRQPDAPA